MALFQFGRKKKPVQKRGFDGAQGGRLFSDWVLQGMSADSEIRGNLNQLRVRCRDLANNDPYAKKYLRLLRDNVVGETGFNLQVQAKNDDGQLDEYGNDIIETQFKLWSQVGNCTADGKQSLADVTQMVIQGLARDGEVLIRKVFYPNNWGFALEILEPDLLDENLNATAPNGNAIRMGVEIDGYRRPVAYHLKSKHPGDNMAMASGQAIQRVEADKIIHLYDMERAQQTRGIPWMSNGVQSLKMLKGYREAEMVAKRVGAAKMGFFYSETGDEYVGDDYESGGENGHHGPKIMDAEPGTLTELPAGMRFEEFNPSNTSTEFQQFEKAILRGIASGWGVSYHSLANDLTQTSYSSIRQGTLEDRDFYKGLQKFIINHFLRPVYQSWLEQSFLTNAIPFSITKLDKFALSSMFRPRGFQWVDPAREIAAHIQALNSGLISMQDVANHYGRDVSETFAQIEKDKQLAEKFGLKLAFEPFGGGVSGYGPSKVDPETGEPVTDDQGETDG